MRFFEILNIGFGLISTLMEMCGRFESELSDQLLGNCSASEISSLFRQRIPDFYDLSELMLFALLKPDT